MSQLLDHSVLRPDDAHAAPRLWGLSALSLHTAFWRARGVQCVRRGLGDPIERGAELYLLIETHQFVLFTLAELKERLAWGNATITRLRIVDRHREPYSEHVVTDQNGSVSRVERRYQGTMYGAYRVVLTSSRRAASIWSNATSRRDGWVHMRRAVRWSQVDHCRLDGWVLDAHRADSRRRLLDELVIRWPRPDQAITGIQEISPGVWGVAGVECDPSTPRIGPLWIGQGAADDHLCLVGPAWFADAANAECGNVAVCSFEEVELTGNEPSETRRNHPVAYACVKRTIDVLGSLMALILSAPIMIVVALLILCEDGRPLFFGHLRQGRGGRRFRCWKFRTMHRDAERLARTFQERNLCDGPQVCIEDDPRVTRVGRVLRKTHLDELPQFWNVLVGQMSLVGPRPSPDDENQYCPSWRDARLSVRPGMTGLWQLKRTRAPGEDFQEWIRYDLEYVREAGIGLDLRILMNTARLFLTRRGERASN